MPPLSPRLSVSDLEDAIVSLSGDWQDSYSDRERDLVSLLCAWLEVSPIPMQEGQTLNFFLDYNDPASQNRVLFASVAPLLLSHHKIGWFKLTLGNGKRIATYVRHLLGLEELWIIGYQRDIKVKGISDTAPKMRFLKSSRFGHGPMCRIVAHWPQAPRPPCPHVMWWLP